jgi:crotonobetainyl-CoA:carnitine CoA-transferase CaiB-like acyl-CoA transferase
MPGPLQGLRILECGGYLSAPSACYMLADLGAEVIKIEDRIKGDPSRGMSALFGRSMSLPGDLNIMFETANRNKKSITVDLKKEQGRDLLYELIKHCDAFCTNYSQSAIDKLKMDYETLSGHNPMLIYGLATGYGSLGPDSRKRAFDTIAQARSGIMYAVGEPDSPPAQIAGPIFDQITGTLLAYGILAALIARDKTGTGQKVDVSLLGSGLHLQAYNVNTVLLRNRPIPRPSRSNQRNALANHYECADGKWILFAEAQSDRFWHDFCCAMEIEELENDERFATAKLRNDHRSELTGILDKVFKKKTRSEWVKALEEKGGGIAFSPVLDPNDLKSDPQILSNEYIKDTTHRILGETKVIGCPVRFSRTPVEINPSAPAFGENTEEVLLDVCNLTWEDIEKLKDDEII